MSFRKFIYILRALLLLSIISIGSLKAQKIFRVEGVVKDGESGETLPLANIAVNNNFSGTSSDNDGRFVLRLPEGIYSIKTTYVGYGLRTIELDLKGDTSISFDLTSTERSLREVVVVEERIKTDPVRSAQSSMVKMDQKDIEMVPTIAGENDIIKVVQLLPGVNKGIEGTGDFFVRGGDADQNLLLLDGASIYNTGHLFGFVSVFNPDIIGEATVLRGAFPAYYGGRLSSILDVRTRPTYTDKVEGEGSVGLLSSKLTVRTPIKKNKMGLMISGRRTYIDQIIRGANLEFQLPYYFYDLNGRFDYRLNDKHSFYVSGYYGADILTLDQSLRSNDSSSFQSNNDISNHSQTIGWQYRASESFKLNAEIHQSAFEYDIRNSFAKERIQASSGIRDLGITVNGEYRIDDRNSLTFGLSNIYHSVQPIQFTTDGIFASIIPTSRSNGKRSNETSLYGELSHDLTEKIKVRLGYRQSFGMVDGIVYPNAEPRLAARYLLGDRSSLKISYSRMSQYLHRVSSSSITLPVDLWYSITKDIKPQTANQYTIGYAWKQPAWNITLETDLYYKDMRNLTEYEQGTTLLFNAEFEDALLQGRGESYGAEFLVRKEGDKFYGWLSYSLGWSFRQFDELNDGEPFNATYDRRHNGAVVLQYNFWKRLAISGVWEYISGSRFTPVTGQYTVINPINTGIDIVNIFSDRNAYTLSDAHRLDLMLILKSNKKRRFQGEWRAGVYNVYNRATPVQVYIRQNAGQLEYVQPGLFGTLPFISYHFKF